MKRKSTGSSETREKPGPKPETVKIEGNWMDAVKKALGVKRPESGWPKDDKKD